MPKQDYLLKCPELLKEFLFYIKTIKGCSEKTVFAYYTDLSLFFRYILSIQNNLDIADIDSVEIIGLKTEFFCNITLNDVYAFLNYTIDVRHNSASTRSRKVSSIRAFYDYLTTKTPYLKDNPVSNLSTPKIGQRLPVYLSLEESIDLLKNANTSSPKRDFLIITLFINCGMRISELVGINLGDFTLSDNENSIKIIGKGNKQRIVYLNKACILALEDYLKNERKHLPNDNAKAPLFLSRQDKRITVRRVEQIVDECLKNANLDGKGYSPHKLRHTAATLMHKKGADMLALKEILGHENVSTTQIYTHLSKKEIENVMLNSPLANFKNEDKNNKNKE